MSEQLTLEGIYNMLASLTTTVNRMEKRMKLQASKARKANNKDNPRPISGFAKPRKISEQLCTFLNIPFGTEIAHTEVTKRLTEYIKQHDLQNPENRRELVLDDNLKNLLMPEEGAKLTFFSIQKYIQQHFVKPEAPPTEPEAPQTTTDPEAPPTTTEPEAPPPTTTTTTNVKVKRPKKKSS